MKLILAALIFLPLVAHAGKEERDYKNNKLEPSMHTAEGAFKGACGCALKITIDDSVKSKDEMYNAHWIPESIKDTVAKFCTDVESKKAICKMKELTIKKGSEASFKMSGSTGVSTIDNSAHYDFEAMTKVLDE